MIPMNHLMMFVRFKIQKNKGKFNGDFHQYKRKKFLQNYPGEKMGFFSFYHMPILETVIFFTMFLLEAFVIFNLN